MTYYTNDTSSILRILSCYPETHRAQLPIDYNQLISKIQQEFEDDVAARRSELQNTTGRALRRKYVLENLQVIYDQVSDAGARKTVSYITHIFAKARLPRRCHNELNTLRIRGVLLSKDITHCYGVLNR
jgi:hypothetical protein